MGLRFRRSVRIAPGIRLNLTKTGYGMTVGPRGYHYSVHSGGRRTRTIGLPGTGLYYQSTWSSGSRRTAPPTPRSPVSAPRATPIDPAAVIPGPGFLASAAEKAYHAGVLAYLRHDASTSLASFEETLATDPTATSAHLFAGVVAENLGDDPRAIGHLEAVVRSGHPLPDRYEAHYLADPRIAISLKVGITPAVVAQVPFSELGASLTLAELYQRSGRLSEAIGLVEQIHTAVPNPLVRLSLADLLLADHDYEGTIEVTDGVVNESDIAAELLHIRGAAMLAQGHAQAAVDVFRSALAKTAGRDLGLLTAIRFDRGLAYEQLGQHGRARADLEKVYAADPTFEDVQERLATLGPPGTGAST